MRPVRVHFTLLHVHLKNQRVARKYVYPSDSTVVPRSLTHHKTTAVGKNKEKNVILSVIQKGFIKVWPSYQRTYKHIIIVSFMCAVCGWLLEERCFSSQSPNLNLLLTVCSQLLHIHKQYIKSRFDEDCPFIFIVTACRSPAVRSFITEWVETLNQPWKGRRRRCFGVYLFIRVSTLKTSGIF